METSRHGEVSLQRHGELVQQTLTCGRRVGNEDAGLGGVVYAVRRVDKLAHLQKSRPHGALATGNGCAALAVVEQLVHDDGASQTEQTQLDAANIEQPRVRLVDDVQVVNLVLARSQLLQHLDVFAGAPYCVDGDVQCVCLIKEQGQL